MPCIRVHRSLGANATTNATRTVVQRDRTPQQRGQCAITQARPLATRRRLHTLMRGPGATAAQCEELGPRANGRPVAAEARPA